MNTTTRIRIAERFGHGCGRGWRAYVRGERRMAAWLVAHGLPAAGATVLLWIVKLGVVAVFLYTTFWITVLALLVVAAVWVMEGRIPEEDRFELQFPTIEELRNSPGYDPNLYNDTSHEMYQDD
jgi:hypothetical protein